MAIFTQFKDKCQKCGKEFKTLGFNKGYNFVKDYRMFSFCPKCSKELGKIIQKWLKNNK